MTIEELAVQRSPERPAAGLPPGPARPAPVQSWEWARRPLPLLERCRETYGDTFTLRLMHLGPWVVLSDPADVKRVFTAAPTAMAATAANVVLEPLLGRRSVMLLDEPEHIARRRLILPPFHGRRLAGSGPVVAEATRREVARWPVGEPFELWPRMQAITLDVIMAVVFGEAGPHLAPVRAALEQLTTWLNDPRRLMVFGAIGSSWITRHRGFRRVRGRVEAAVLAEVRRRKALPGGTDGDDVISILAHARYEDGRPLSDRDLADELITLLSDGPTSTTLAWTFERLLRRPAELARVRVEIEAGDGPAPFLDAVVKEVLRLYPPVPVVVRRVTAPMELADRTLPAGTVVAPCIYLMHRRADVYDRPEEFRPERFLETPPGTYTWIPFGGGARRCLAANFALAEIRQVMRTILTEVDLRAVESEAEQVARSSIAFVPARQARVLVAA